MRRSDLPTASVEEAVRVVRRIVSIYAPPVHDAEDLEQSAVLAVLRALSSNGDPPSLRALSVKVARAVCIDYLRRRYRSRETVWPEGLHAQSREPISPLETLIRKESVHSLRNRLRELPDRYKRAIELRYEQGLSTKQVADRMSAKEATVRTWLFRARRLVADRIPGSPGSSATTR